MFHKMVLDAYLGIDLGTSNSAAALYLSDQPDHEMMVTMEQGGYLLRSVVEYLNDGRVVVGRRTLNTKGVLEGNVVMNMKRLIGRKFEDDTVKTYFPMCKAEVVKGPHGFASFRIPALNNRILLPEEVCSEIIRVLYTRALTVLGDRYKLKCMAISVPAYFSQDQRVATCNAIKFAGITLPVHVVNEPSAAALSFGIENEFKEGNVVTYDLGGGTFDITVMKVRNGNEFEVLASSGINTIGGENFDEYVLKYVVDEYQKNMHDGPLPSPSSTNYYRAFCRLEERCREVKEELSAARNEVDVEVDEYIRQNVMTKDQRRLNLQEVFELTLSLNKLNELIKDDIDKTFDKMYECIKEAGLTKDDVSKVVLVGGSSRLALVRSKLGAEFENRISQTVKVDECVSSGAALYAYEIDVGKMGVTDVTKYNIYTCPGSRHNRNKWQVFIEKGSVLPLSKEKIFRTCEDHIGVFKDELYEGNTKEDAHQLAAMRVHGITEYDDGHAVELRYKISISQGGVLTYSVTEVESGKLLVEDTIVGYGK